MNEHDHKAFEYWWPKVPKINFAGTESEKYSAEAAWIAALARRDKRVAELVQAVELINTEPGNPMSCRLGAEHAKKLAAKLKAQQ